MKQLLATLSLIGSFAGNKRQAESESTRNASMARRAAGVDVGRKMEEFIERDCFSLMVQPMVDFRTNTSFGGEVLARLNHPERGVVSPEEFLPIVDIVGLYPVFDRYIFRKSCAWLSSFLEEGKQLDCLSCNISRRTLSEAGLAQDLIRMADQYGIPHGKLALEITEREEETDPVQLLENLKQLKDAGFRIILDDYGNGVTSRKDLMQYPLDTVKMDRSLLRKAQTEEGRQNYRELVALAAKMGTEIVCEGIETEEQSRFAREAGCHYGQGFLFVSPVPQEQAFDMMCRSRAV